MSQLSDEICRLKQLAKASVKPHTDFKYIGKGIVKQVKAKTAI